MPGIDNLNQAVAEMIDALVDFVAECSITHDDINARSGPGGLYVVGWNPWRWAEPLPDAAQRPLGLARAATKRAHDMVWQAVNSSEPSRIGKFEASWGLFDRILDQDASIMGGAPDKSIDGVISKVRAQESKIAQALAALPTAHAPGGTFIVPDTNALMYEPDLTRWDTGERVTLVIVPEVVRELDRLKMRTSGVADKAQKVINQLNEFERRGDPSTGVKVAGRLWLREVATYPDLDAAPAVLDRGLEDDRILMSALELGFADLNASVTVATRDRNKRNRARLVGVPCVDVTEVVAERAAAGGDR